MVTNPALDHLFTALADPTRRAIVARLARGDAPVGELAARFPMSRPAISKHLNVLERAGLVERVPRGRVNMCRLEPRPLREAAEWVARYRGHWEGRLEALQHYLETEEEEG